MYERVCVHIRAGDCKTVSARRNHPSSAFTTNRVGSGVLKVVDLEEANAALAGSLVNNGGVGA
jgi:hypothetical protein